MNSQPGAPLVLLFDVGGVLIELGPPPIEPSWLAGRSVEALWRDWISMPDGRDFERGLTEPQEFAESIIERLQLTVTIDDFLDKFTRWPVGPYPGTLQWLASLQDRATLALLSNTNVLHARRMREEMHFVDIVDIALFSHELGCVKPDPDCFETAISRLGVPAERIAFFDDNRINVDAARACGLQAFQTQGPTELRQVVASLF